MRNPYKQGGWYNEIMENSDEVVDLAARRTAREAARNPQENSVTDDFNDGKVVPMSQEFLAELDETVNPKASPVDDKPA